MPKFTWTNKEDDEVYKNGTLLMWAAGSTQAIQRFVEDLSNRVGVKADYAFAGGRAHIEILPEGYDDAMSLINDGTFMAQYHVPYSDESIKNKTYFERLM